MGRSWTAALWAVWKRGWTKDQQPMFLCSSWAQQSCALPYLAISSRTRSNGNGQICPQTAQTTSSSSTAVASIGRASPGSPVTLLVSLRSLFTVKGGFIEFIEFDPHGFTEFYRVYRLLLTRTWTFTVDPNLVGGFLSWFSGTSGTLGMVLYRFPNEFTEFYWVYQSLLTVIRTFTVDTITVGGFIGCFLGTPAALVRFFKVLPSFTGFTSWFLIVSIRAFQFLLGFICRIITGLCLISSLDVLLFFFVICFAIRVLEKKEERETWKDKTKRRRPARCGRWPRPPSDHARRGPCAGRSRLCPNRRSAGERHKNQRNINNPIDSDSKTPKRKKTKEDPRPSWRRRGSWRRRPARRWRAGTAIPRSCRRNSTWPQGGATDWNKHK